LNKNKVVLVTGGAKRIGKSLSEYFHKKNYDVALHYNNSSKEAEELSINLNKLRNNSCKIYQANLTETDSVTNLLREIKKENKNLHILINNASSFYPTPINKANLEDWYDLSFTNLISPFILIKGLKDLLKKNEGCIINISDAMAKKGIDQFSLYSAAKSGLEAITKSFAKELSPKIRVNAIAPGAILWPELKNNEGSLERETILKTIPLGRTGEAADIASAAYFISQSKYMTGQVINIDGGRSLS
tara:strand:+ start:8236 stop:8973 length:738 start_codon:yes stop_codon:yes gene_type:complete